MFDYMMYIQHARSKNATTEIGTGRSDERKAAECGNEGTHTKKLLTSL